MRHDAEVASDRAGEGSGDASGARQVASPKPRDMPERPVELCLLDLESFGLAW